MQRLAGRMAPSDAADGGRLGSVTSRAYTVPTDRPEADGTLEWSSTTVVVAEVTADGESGLGWTYASGACRAVIEGELAHAVEGLDPLDLPGAHARMVRGCRNLGRPGVVASAISAVDVALHDLKARLLGIPLAGLFGRCRDDVPVYGSGGFTSYDDSVTSAQLEHFAGTLGIPRVKIKIGESWGADVPRDLARAALARRVIGPDAELYVDANGGYSAKQAVRVGDALTEQRVTWFEEPVSSDDLAGLREVRDLVRQDVAAGEYGYDESYFARMVGAGAVDCLQVDVTRCGGYTSFLRAAALAYANGLQVSAHCAPHLHAHVAGSLPNLRHVEYFHDHVRLDPMLFDGVPELRDGALRPDMSVAGHGMTLRESEAERFRVG